MLASVDTWATVAVAIGTIGAVGYALFRDLVVTPRRRPKLELQFDPGSTDQVVVETAEGFDAPQVRLRVTNRTGKDTADDVVVMVTELRELDGSDDPEVRPVGLPLTWSGSSPPLSVASVHPGSERHVDFLHVDRSAGDDAAVAPLRLDLTPRPTGSRDALDAGTYEISIEVRARNADAIRYAIPVSWDGAWERVRIEPPRQVR
jgi:hypothetical protein